MQGDITFFHHFTVKRLQNAFGMVFANYNGAFALAKANHESNSLFDGRGLYRCRAKL